MITEIRLAGAAAMLALCGCGRQPDMRAGDTTGAPHPGRDSAASAASAPATDTSSAPPPRDIYIDSVTAANPVVVFGHARTFENGVQARVRDDRGEVIGEVHETSTGEMGQHNPFVARIWLVRDPGARMTVEAFDYSPRDGEVIGLTSRTMAAPAARSTLQVHFASTDCTTKAFARTVPRAVAVARLLAEMLVAGPTDAERQADAYQAFPQGTQVNSVVRRGDTLTADFNERLRNVGGSCTARALRDAITRTLSLPGVRSVVITADGSAKLALQP